jgi:isoaspartyl peptidase/L-asparaginase-like protein (Ntn-hydrolase superfamily)
VIRSIAIEILLATACAKEAKQPEPPAPPSASPSPTTWKAAAIAHAGVGSPPDRSDGPRKAVDAALAVLEAGGDPLDAAVAGVVVLEDDPRFNAGTGSVVRLDGLTVQMDASVMRSDGEFGAVSVIEGVKNPVKVARAVADTPHLLLSGDGATAFARTLGMEPYDPTTADRANKTREIQRQLLARDPALPEAWRTFDWRKGWNFERTLKEAGLDPGHDTVGVLVRAADGRFAAALSTGGTTITLRGRVGDVPILGAGLFAGPHGAIAATGTGERIIEAALARKLHDLLGQGVSTDDAAARGVAEMKGKGDIGLIVIGPMSMSAAADRQMAWAARESGSTVWLGPDPGAPATTPR